MAYIYKRYGLRYFFSKKKEVILSIMKEKKVKIKIPKGCDCNGEVDKYSNAVLFPEISEGANENLKTVGIPEL